MKHAIRNISNNRIGTLDCEIEHPVLGWVAYTLSREETDEIRATGQADNLPSYVEPPIDINFLRKDATLKRPEFCLALKKAGILTRDESRRAAKGEWPAAFSDVLGQMTEDEQDLAEATWFDATTVNRMAPLILTLAAARPEITDAVLDALFGVEV